MIENEMHPVQSEVLRILLFKPRARFSELNITGLSNDHFTFHLKRLSELGLIKKDNEQYELTVHGKEFANRMSAETAKFEKQAKVAILVIGVRQKRRKKEYLIQQRLKQPYYGFYGFVTGKVKWGEAVAVAAKREFGEETDLTGEPVLVGVEHKMDIKDSKVQEDKYFYVFRIDNPTGKLKESFDGGKNLWVLAKEIEKFPKVFDDVADLLKLVGERQLRFFEKKYAITEY